jgi:hypothetical protein
MKRRPVRVAVAGLVLVLAVPLIPAAAYVTAGYAACEECGGTGRALPLPAESRVFLSAQEE